MLCKMCKSPMLPKGGFVVIESEVIDGISLVIIKADNLDPDAAGEHVCGVMCLLRCVDKKLDGLAGRRLTFPSSRLGDSPGARSAA